MDDDGLTAEQLARIEFNRQQALERARQRCERTGPPQPPFPFPSLSTSSNQRSFPSSKHTPSNNVSASLAAIANTFGSGQGQGTVGNASKDGIAVTGQTNDNANLRPQGSFFQPNAFLNKKTFEGETGTASKKAEKASDKKQNKLKLLIQLDTPTTFSIASIPLLVATFKQIPEATYIKDENVWRFPLEMYETVLDRLPSRPSNEEIIPKVVLQLFARPIQPPRPFNLAVLDKELLEALYPFQKEGIEMALNRGGRVLLADDMGLGKSIQALGIASFYRLAWPLLIISPASMVASWHEQIKRWLPSVPVDRITVVYDGKAQLEGLVNILSYDLAVKLVPDSGRSFQVIIADECHALKNAESKRSKTLVPILKKASQVVLLSGTPALSRPQELYPQICAIQPKLFPKFFDFGRRYCNGTKGYFGWDFKGASNLKELQLILERTILIRRTKDSVLTQLPRKLRHQVKKKDLDEYKKLVGLRDIPAAGDGEEALDEWLKRAEYMALWKRSAEIKLPAALEYIDDLLEAGHKMLIFAHHLSIIDAIEAHMLANHVRSMRIDGKTPPAQRQELCNDFQSSPSLRVAILSITAASTGLTLTAATTVIFAELFWNPGVLLQAEDRAHRIGQNDAVNVHYLLARDTADDNIWPMILRKLTLLEAVGLGRNDFYTINKQEHDPAQRTLDSFLATKRPIIEIVGSDNSDFDDLNTKQLDM